jgi:hypothetical protein
MEGRLSYWVIAKSRWNARSSSRGSAVRHDPATLVAHFPAGVGHAHRRTRVRGAPGRDRYHVTACRRGAPRRCRRSDRVEPDGSLPREPASRYVRPNRRSATLLMSRIFCTIWVHSSAPPRESVLFQRDKGSDFGLTRCVRSHQRAGLQQQAEARTFLWIELSAARIQNVPLTPKSTCTPNNELRLVFA